MVFKLVSAFINSYFTLQLLSSNASAAPSPGTVEVPPAAAASAKSVKSIPPKPIVMLLSRAVGEVGDRVVTSREVRIDDAVEQALVQKPSTAGHTFRVLGGQEKSFPSDVTKVLDEWVIDLEAKALSIDPMQSVSRAELSERIKSVQEFWAGKPGWAELEVSPEELRDVVDRKLLVKQFEKLKSDPSLAPISDDEALAYYRKNRSRFGAATFPDVRDGIKGSLSKAQTERRLIEWREVLRRKYKVRNFISG